MSDISQEVQKEVSRIQDMISTTKALLPNGQCNFIFYEMLISQAEKAVREQDAVALVCLLPELRKMQ